MSDGDRPRILIADDREENRYVLCRILEGAGFRCTQASSGHGALEIAQSLPDLIILDVHLPDISGYEVCQQIKQDPRTRSVSVLQISASFVSSEDRVRALEGGADGYLTHPIDRLVLVATVRSLLRLRNAENMARKSAEQWQTTFDALAEGLAVVDAGNRLLRWNNAFSELCGPMFQPQIGHDAAGLFLDAMGDDAPFRLNGHKRHSAEFVIDGRTLQLTVSKVGIEGEGAEKIIVLNDFTDRKLAEYALRTAEKLAATGKLANAIAHEINNPLEALTNLIYLAGRTPSIDEVKDLLRHADFELARIARITKQSLSFHRDTQVPIAMDVGDLVGDIVALFERTAASRRVHLTYDRTPTPPIYGFPGQLSQVVGNLVRNAAEASAPETAVSVRVRTIHRREREGVRISIHDRGRGIPIEVQKKMFDPFFTTKDLKGSGLGLWVSKSLVLKHGGTIRFRSSQRMGRSGTTFEVFLPKGGIDPDSSSHEDGEA